MINLAQIDHWLKINPLFVILLIIFALIDLGLRGYALWKSAKTDKQLWFIALLIVNSLGILPAVYLLFFAPKSTNKS